MPTEVSSPSSTERTVLTLGVLVLNYNTWDLALRAMDAALSLDADRIEEFVIYDDGSTTLPLTKIDHRIRVIRNRENKGFSRALCSAFSQMQSDIVILFDSDAYPITAFASSVREQFSTDANLAQLGFQAVNDSGDPTECYLPEPTQSTLLLGQALAARWLRHEIADSNLCVITGCMATRAMAYRSVNGFDTKLDFLDVDVDYSMRLRRAGWKVACDLTIKVFHVGGGTAMLQSRRVLAFYKSRWHVLRKHGLFTSVFWARRIILSRLVLEKSMLTIAGRLIFRDQKILTDKLSGRIAIIEYCKRNYF